MMASMIQTVANLKRGFWRNKTSKLDIGDDEGCQPAKGDLSPRTTALEMTLHGVTLQQRE